MQILQIRLIRVDYMSLPRVRLIILVKNHLIALNDAVDKLRRRLTPRHLNTRRVDRVRFEVIRRSNRYALFGAYPNRRVIVFAQTLGIKRAHFYHISLPDDQVG